jgi:flagellar FliL protein
MAGEIDESDQASDDDADVDVEGEGAVRRRLSGKIVVLAGAVVLVLFAVGGGAWWMGLFGGGGSSSEVVQVKPSIFYDMPEMLVNLSMSDESRSRFLKIRVALEMTDTEARDSIEPQLPRIMDIFQIYLRELRLEDLEGSAGVYRLKEELLRRVNLILSPQRVDRILFREMLVQ